MRDVVECHQPVDDTTKSLDKLTQQFHIDVGNIMEPWPGGEKALAQCVLSPPLQQWLESPKHNIY